MIEKLKERIKHAEEYTLAKHSEYLTGFYKGQLFAWKLVLAELEEESSRSEPTDEGSETEGREELGEYASDYIKRLKKPVVL